MIVIYCNIMKIGL